MTLIEIIMGALRGHSALVSSENELSDVVAFLLDDAGLLYEREVRLDARNRLDFLVHLHDESVALELKTEGSRASLLRQLERYSRDARVHALGIVTTRRGLCRAPDTFNGKPVFAVHMGGF